MTESFSGISNVNLNNETQDREEFLTENEIRSMIPFTEISNPRSEYQRKKKGKTQIDGQINLDEYNKSLYEPNRVNLPETLLDETPIGKTETGLPVYRKEKEFYIPDIERVPRNTKENLSTNYLAFIKKESLDIVREILKTNLSDKELAEKLVVFKRGTSIFFEKNDAIHLGKVDVIAIKNNLSADSHEFPFYTESYTYLTNLTNNPRKMGKLDKNDEMRACTSINSVSFIHPEWIKTGTSFFADYRDAIETKVSIKNTNGIISKH